MRGHMTHCNHLRFGANLYAPVAQLAEALVLGTKCCEFDSHREHHFAVVAQLAEALP